MDNLPAVKIKNHRFVLFVVTGIGILCMAIKSHAIAPPYVSDQDLAQYPVIVVAKWQKDAPFNDTGLVEGNVRKEWELRTEIVIERVIKGKIKPGKHTVLLGYAIGWQEDGHVMSFTSTQMVGDVSNVMASNLWFLKSTRSWNPKDKSEYAHLDTYRGVQPAGRLTDYADCPCRTPLWPGNLSALLP